MGFMRDINVPVRLHSSNLSPLDLSQSYDDAFFLILFLKDCHTRYESYELPSMYMFINADKQTLNIKSHDKDWLDSTCIITNKGNSSDCLLCVKYDLSS